MSEGYAYPTPASSYGVPLNSRLSGDNIAQVLPSSFSGSLSFAPPAQTYQLPSAQVVSFAPVVSTTPSTVSLSYQQPSFVSSTPAPVLSNYVQPLQFPSSSASVVSSGFPAVSGGFDSRFSSFSSNSQFSSSAANSGAAQVTKNLYFFSAPEEPEAPIRPRVNVVQAPAQKNYKIIFIKTPEFRQQSVVNVPVVSQNEEKTVVYVLVKRPEDGPQVNVQASSASKPAKPEVYFIKYRTKEEAEAAINNAREGNFAGISANSVENNGFVESLNGAQGNGLVETVPTPASDVETVSIGGGGSSNAEFVSNAAAAPLVSLNVGSSSTTPSSGGFVAVSESSTVEVPTVTTVGGDSFVQNVVVSEERANAPASVGGGVAVNFVSSTPFSVYGPPAKRSVKKF